MKVYILKSEFCLDGKVHNIGPVAFTAIFVKELIGRNDKLDVRSFEQICRSGYIATLIKDALKRQGYEKQFQQYLDNLTVSKKG